MYPEPHTIFKPLNIYLDIAEFYLAEFTQEYHFGIKAIDKKASLITEGLKKILEIKKRGKNSQVDF